MKLFKSIYRYVLAGLLFVASVAWTISCHITVVKQQAYNRSTDFIDLALRSAEKADALLLRAEQFQRLRTIGLVASIVMLLVLTLMIVWHVLSNRWEKENKTPIADFFRSLQEKRSQRKEQRQKKQQEMQEQKEKAKEKKEEAQGGFCPNCGTPYASATGFCGECGCSLEEK